MGKKFALYPVSAEVALPLFQREIQVTFFFLFVSWSLHANNVNFLVKFNDKAMAVAVKMYKNESKSN